MPRWSKQITCVGYTCLGCSQRVAVLRSTNPQPNFSASHLQIQVSLRTDSLDPRRRPSSRWTYGPNFRRVILRQSCHSGRAQDSLVGSADALVRVHVLSPACRPAISPPLDQVFLVVITSAARDPHPRLELLGTSAHLSHPPTSSYQLPPPVPPTMPAWSPIRPPLRAMLIAVWPPDQRNDAVSYKTSLPQMLPGSALLVGLFSDSSCWPLRQWARSPGCSVVYATDLPEITQLEQYRPSSITEIYDDRGKIIGIVRNAASRCRHV